MFARYVVPLTPSEALRPIKPPSREHIASESSQIPLFFFKRLLTLSVSKSHKSFACHRSEKTSAKSKHCHTSETPRNNPCVCHTSETPRGAQPISVHHTCCACPTQSGTSAESAAEWNFSLSITSAPVPLSLSTFLSQSCALFCTFLHASKTQPVSFQAIPHSASKNTTTADGYPPRTAALRSIANRSAQEFARVSATGHEPDSVAGFAGLDVLDAAAEEALFGEFFDEDNLAGNENGGLAGCVRNGNFDEALCRVLLAALEAQAGFGHVLAGDDVVSALGVANAGRVGDFDAGMLAALGAGGGGLLQNLRGKGEDSPRRPGGLRGRRECGRRGERQWVCFRRHGFLVHHGQHRSPESRGAATLAKAENAVVGGADVGFDAGTVDFFEGFAGAAD